MLRRGFRLWRWHISWICTGAFDVVSYHEQLSSEQLRLNEDNLTRYRAFQESGTDVQCTASEPYLYIIFTVYDRWAGSHSAR